MRGRSIVNLWLALVLASGVLLANVPVAAAQGADCGADLGCMANAAASCQPAHMSWPARYDIFGVVVSRAEQLEIRGAQGGQCILSERIAAADAQLTDYGVGVARQSGASPADIDRTVAALHRIGARRAGQAQICWIETRRLHALLQRWAQGLFADDDLVAAGCEGPLVTATQDTAGTGAASFYTDSQAPQIAAIKDVIRRTNAEQEQALATGDPTVMRDTATNRFFQEQLFGFLDSLDAGVTSIDLEDLVFGAIIVEGNTATVATYETWTTTFDDGTMRRVALDHNVYTLVQRNGAWLVSTDDHPDGAAALVSTF